MNAPDKPSEGQLIALGKSIDLIIDHAETKAASDKGMFAEMDNNPMNRQVIFAEVLSLVQTAIDTAVEQAEIEARKDQIVQDFLTYNSELGTDESQLIACRDACLELLFLEKLTPPPVEQDILDPSCTPLAPPVEHKAEETA